MLNVTRTRSERLSMKLPGSRATRAINPLNNILRWAHQTVKQRIRPHCFCNLSARRVVCFFFCSKTFGPRCSDLAKSGPRMLLSINSDLNLKIFKHCGMEFLTPTLPFLISAATRQKNSCSGLLRHSSRNTQVNNILRPWTVRHKNLL